MGNFGVSLYLLNLQYLTHEMLSFGFQNVELISSTCLIATSFLCYFLSLHL